MVKTSRGGLSAERHLTADHLVGRHKAPRIRPPIDIIDPSTCSGLMYRVSPLTPVPVTTLPERTRTCRAIEVDEFEQKVRRYQRGTDSPA